MKKLLILFLSIALLLLAYGSWNLFDYQASRAEKTAKILASTQENLRGAATKIDKLLADLNIEGTRLTREVSENEKLRINLAGRLKELLEANPAVFGAGFIDQTTLEDRQFRKNSPNYYSRWKKHQLGSTDILPMFQEKVYGRSDSDEKILVGTIVIDTSRQYLQNFLNSLHISQHGYPFIIASHGSFVCHPSEKLTQNGKTLYTYAQEDKIASLADLGKAAETSQSGCFDLHSENSGNAMWGILTPISSRKWSLAMLMLKAPVLQPFAAEQKQLFIGMVLIITAIAMTLLLIGLSVSKNLKIRLWVAASLFSLGMAAGIAALWFFNFSNKQYNFPGEIPMTDESTLEHYLDELNYQMALAGHAKPQRIPTGVFIQSVDFQSAVNLKVTGYVWQKFNINDTSEIEEGVIFPDAQEITIEKSYEKISGNTRTVGWSFQLVLREGFEYRTYPFDLESVWLRMWPKEFYKKQVLVPDFASYHVDDPELLPGIDSQLVLPGWQLLQSYFSYLPVSYNTDFGIAGDIGGKEFPELHFNVIVQRNFIDPFISIILPLIVVAILVFILLLTCSREESLKELFGFSAGAILSGIAALFFVVIFAQIDLRKNLEIERIMYMDFYYFVIYFVFLIVSVNSVLFCWPTRIAFIHYDDNLFPKLLYWPLILVVLFITTVAFFCP